MSNLLLLGAGSKAGYVAPTIAGMFTGGYVGDWFDGSDKSKMWQDTATATPVVNNSDPIGHIRGQVNALDYIQATAGNRPLWQTGDWLHFDGANDGLGRTGALGLYTAGACTVVAVAKLQTNIGDYIVSESLTTLATPKYGPMCSDSVTSTVLSAFIRADDNITRVALTQDVATGVWDNTMKVVAVRDSGSQLIPQINNVAGTPLSYTRGGVITVDNSQIGRIISNNVAAGWINGDLAQLFVIGRYLSDAELAFVCTTLGAKQGLTV